MSGAGEPSRQGKTKSFADPPITTGPSLGYRTWLMTGIPGSTILFNGTSIGRPRFDTLVVIVRDLRDRNVIVDRPRDAGGEQNISREKRSPAMKWRRSPSARSTLRICATKYLAAASLATGASP